ncbi:hypothetical protein KCU88_g338, partial [Aureobasidium melanogenum]
LSRLQYAVLRNAYLKKSPHGSRPQSFLDVDHLLHNLATSIAQHGIDLARMDDGEKDCSSKHEDSVENVQKHFMRNQISVVALSVLDQPEHRSDKDQHTAGVKGQEVFLPHMGRNIAVENFRRRDSVHAHVEGDGHDDEE